MTKQSRGSSDYPMATIEDLRFEPQGLRLAPASLLVKIDADLLIRQYDAHIEYPQLAMNRDDLSIWVSEAAAVLHACAALSAKLDLRIDTAAIVQLADSYPDLNALLEQTQWPSAARDMLARCSAAIVRDPQAPWTAADSWTERNARSRRPAVRPSGQRPKP